MLSTREENGGIKISLKIVIFLCFVNREVSKKTRVVKGFSGINHAPLNYASSQITRTRR